jgi:hypothetical protein
VPRERRRRRGGVGTDGLGGVPVWGWEGGRAGLRVQASTFFVTGEGVRGEGKYLGLPIEGRWWEMVTFGFGDVEAIYLVVIPRLQ